MGKNPQPKVPVPEGTISTEVEEKQVEERVAIGAHVVYETIRREGEEELARPAAALAWSGLAAGLSMGFSFLAEALIQNRLPERPWAHLISRLGYSVGFLIVVLGRQQLFTENTLTVILPLLLRKKITVLISVLRLWAIVLTANLVGTFVFAFCVAHIAVFDHSVQQTLTQIGAAHLGVGFGIVLVRAIFAGWLIALMVWLLPAAEHSRLSIVNYSDLHNRLGWIQPRHCRFDDGVLLGDHRIHFVEGLRREFLFSDAVGKYYRRRLAGRGPWAWPGSRRQRGLDRNQPRSNHVDHRPPSLLMNSSLASSMSAAAIQVRGFFHRFARCAAIFPASGRT